MSEVQKMRGISLPAERLSTFQKGVCPINMKATVAAVTVEVTAAAAAGGRWWWW